MLKRLKEIFTIHFDTNRIFGLDILRALAIIFVMLSHGQLLLPHQTKAFTKFFIIDGVSIFFVLSGFLIGGILIKQLETKKVNRNLLFNFWLRRWFRTLPNYFLVLIVLGLISNTFLENFPLSITKSYYIFSQNLFYPHPQFFVEAWSLSIEEWFYILTPLTLFGLIKAFKINVKNAVLITVVAFIVLATWVRVYRFYQLETYTIQTWDLVFRKQVITRLDSIMFGVLAAYFSYYYKALWQNHKKLLLATGVSFFIVLKGMALSGHQGLGFFFFVLSFSFTSVATAMLIPFLSQLKKGAGKLYKYITIFSLTSYSLYLVHHTLVIHWVLKYLPLQYISSTVVRTSIAYFLFWVISILLSIIMYKYFEVPTTKLRDNKRVKRLFVNGKA